MTDHSELVKKLRDLHRDPRPASAEWLFENQVALYDAAAAIEALQEKVDKQDAEITELLAVITKKDTELDNIKTELLNAQDEAKYERQRLRLCEENLEATHVSETTYREMCEALQAQLPKREEVWKDVIGYEGLYQVSDQARVRNNKGKILKQSVKVGKCVYYKYVKLYKDGQYRQGYVHRMMAECFIPNPDNLPIINHKDEDGTNNRLDNLEWCTVEYNSNYGNAKRNMSRGKRRRAKMEVQE